MFRKLAIALCVAGLAAAPALAQTASPTTTTGPDWWTSFTNSDGSMKAETDVNAAYSAMTADQQAKVKDDCTKNGAPGGGGGMQLSEAQQQFCNMITKM